MSASSAFFQLDTRIQHYLWSEGWGALRAVQERAIPKVLPADRDVVIAASTASGKTEAAFLPALTHLLSRERPGLILYISPLKALINDQFERLDRLCENLEVPVWPWHGDVSASSKARFLRDPWGVLLITPESLEAMFCNRGTAVSGLFQRAAYLIVDELHAFIGSERGKQLQSLMHRIETALGRRLPRIGLSATLGDIQLAARFLRNDGTAEIVDVPSGGSELKVLVKGYEEPIPDPDSADDAEERAPPAIAQHLYAALRGTNNLVFPNSRREVELYTHLLRSQCENARVPNEFWPHHGNLSREIRYETEAALKQKERPATAICTSTLELGIDIGAVRSVCQIGTPPSVASLRQRLGRSGRRPGEPAILRGYVIERTIDKKSDLATRLRLDTVQMAAAISLLLENWFEPPVVHGAHFSTLIQQLLSAIAQYGGLSAAQAYRLLCAPGAPFEGVSKEDFGELLRHLGQQEILVQDGSGLLLHGRVGDKLVNHYSFYAAFSSDEEFRVIAGGKTLGTLPVDQMLTVGQRILFGGRTWLVEDIDEEGKAIHVTPAKGGAPPLFNGGIGRVHTTVRRRMRDIYERRVTTPFLDGTADRFVGEGQDAYAQLGLDQRFLLDQGSAALVLTWLGDSANEALACIMMTQGFKAASVRLGIEVTKAERTMDDIRNGLADAAMNPPPSMEALVARAGNLARQKWDGLLSPRLLRTSYASLNLAMDEAMIWLLKADETSPEEQSHTAEP
jgi:ATP-dependent Lhr-like helicase